MILYKIKQMKKKDIKEVQSYERRQRQRPVTLCLPKNSQPNASGVN